MSEGDFVTAREASEMLGVTLPTLYAYVSRGQLRSLTPEGRSRVRLYPRQDVERLKQRQDLKRRPREAAESALRWGIPILPSALTLISDGHLYYRGQDAVRLSQTATLEAVAALLWTGDSDLAGKIFSPTVPLALLDDFPGRSPIQLMSALLPLIEEDDAQAFDLRPESTFATAARILSSFAWTITRSNEERDIADRLAIAWQAPQAAPDLRTALILCADHELNVSSFTARCVASAGTTLYGCVAAGLAALAGLRHGGTTARVAAFLDEVDRLGDPGAAVIARQRRGETVEGFGHPLYPAGDPRATALLSRLSGSKHPLIWTLNRAAETAKLRPNIDAALVALSRIHRLPDHAPLTIFALGRTVGLCAHAIEEYASGSLIRPRARYVGVSV